MYESDITLPSYTNVEEKEVDAREQQLTEIREALEKFLGNADFDLESVVENSLFPYLEKNNVVYLSLFTNLNPIVEGVSFSVPVSSTSGPTYRYTLVVFSPVNPVVMITSIPIFLPVSSSV